MEVATAAAALFVLLVLLVTTAYLLHSYVYWEARYLARVPRIRLPPGSMGWPLLGDTLEFRSPCPLMAYPRFFHSRQARYGNLFKCHIIGCPSIVSTEPAVNQFILQKEGTLFKARYPSIFSRILGEYHISNVHGNLHAKLRSLILQYAGPKAAHSRIKGIGSKISRKLKQWEEKRLVHVQEEAIEMAFDLVTSLLIGVTTETFEGQRLKRSFSQFWQGFTAIPINIPGTRFHRCLKGHRDIIDVINGIISRRTAFPEQHDRPQDLLDLLLLEEKATNGLITRPVTLSYLLDMIYAGFQTTSVAVTLVVLFLTRNPDILEEMRREHLNIQSTKEGDDETLSMEDYKAMAYTRKVIFETLRIGNIAPVVCREAVVDIEINGFVIPRGWKVYPCFTSVHLDPKNYHEALKFNPMRWKDAVSTSGPLYSPFGAGPRHCAGDELTILEISIFLHHFTTKYSWKEVGEVNVVRSPSINFENSYRIAIEKCS